MKKQHQKPPKFAIFVMILILPDYLCRTTLGDYEEIFNRIEKTEGRFKAVSWYWIQILKSTHIYVFNSIKWSFIMFKNYLKLTFRNLKRYKGFSLINIIGLASGLAISFILAFYVIDDIKYDRFHENADNIYRLYSLTVESNTAATSGPLVLKVKEELPEIISTTRMWRYGRVNAVPQGGEEAGSNPPAVTGSVVLTDPGFFEVFSFEIISGESAEVLKEPGKVFITAEFAKALFGSEDPVGKSLQISRVGSAIVAGIVEKPPKHSHIQFDIIAPLIVEQNPVWWDSWQNNGLFGYALLAENADPASVEEKMNVVGKNNNYWEVCKPKLQPLLDIHLGSSDYNYDFINSDKNDRTVVIALGSVGIFVLIIACINFVNLSAARSTRRAREAGIRKVVGSNKKQLFFQFINESVLVTFISFIIAVVILVSVSPYLNSLLKKQLDLNVFENPVILMILFLISVIFGILSGIYPAAVISSFKPVSVIKGELSTGRTGILMRRILIIFQFGITIALVLAVLTVYAQIDYMDSVNLGYDRDNVIVIPSGIPKGEDVFKERLAELSSISGLGRMSVLPSPSIRRGQIIPPGSDKSKNIVAALVEVDESAFETLSIEIAEGRNFSKEFTADAGENIIVNETLARVAGLADPVGKLLELENERTAKMEPKRIVGVTKDFHFFSPKQAIEPMVFTLNPERSRLLFAKISGSETERAVGEVEKIYKEVYPGAPFNYLFFDDYYDNQFNSDRDFASNVGIFGAIAVYIACLGLIGMVSHATEQRRKDIAVRKVLGCRSS
ncbi:ABC transporter permease, partial [candidate division KSB1 bacterium]